MKDPFNHMSDTAKHFFDGLSVATVLGTLVDMLPSIAAAFTIVWTSIRIYETETVQSVLSKRKAKKDKKDD